MKNRVLAAILSVCILTSVPASRNEVSAASRQLNIQTTFGVSETTIYGVPNAFMGRFTQISEKVATAYRNNFSVTINMTKPTTNFVINSVADQCRYNSGGGNYDSICLHVSNDDYCENNGPYHCNNCGVIKSDVHNTNSNSLQMHITATMLCNQGDTHSNGLSGMWYSDGFMVVRDKDYLKQGNLTNLTAYEATYVSKSVAHEIGHELGADDHYNGENTSGVNCIWGPNKDTDYVANNLIMCSACRVKILQYSNEYF